MAKNKKKKLAKYIAPAAAVVVIGAGLAIVLNLPDSSENQSTDDLTTAAEINVSVDKDKLHQAEPKLDSNGELKENGKGSLLSYIPRNIKTIEVENTKSSYKIKSYTPVTKGTDADGKETDITDTTQYTIVGYEDITLREGQADSIANDVAALDFTKISSVDGKNSDDFGFDKPQATVKITYEDDTTAQIIVGANAPTNAGVYLKFGTNDTIYLVDSDSVDSLLYGLNDLVTLDVTTSADDGANASMSTIELGGKLYSDKVTIEANTSDSTASSNYLITSPIKTYGDDSNISEIEAGIRGIYADSVVYVNPKQAQLKKYGLDTPYATIKATYPDATVNLIASKPNDKGYCNLMVKGGNVIYKILSDSIKWTQKSLDDLRSCYFVDNTLNSVEQCDVKFDKNNYSFTLNTEKTTTVDDDGNEQTASTTKVYYKGKEINQGSFQTAFDYMHSSSFERKEFTNVKLTTSPSMTISFKYTAESGRADDVLKFYEKYGKMYVTVNDEQISYVYTNSAVDLQKLFTTASKSKA